MLLPFVWMIATSLKPAGEVFQYPPTLVGSSVEWQNYATVLFDSPFLKQLWNTAFIAVLTLIGTLVTSSMAGFAFSWVFKYPGKDSLFVVVLITIMIPYHVLLVPTFALLRDMGLLDSPWAIILPTVVSPFGIFLMRQFYIGVPKELAEAATLDGCSPWGIYWRIFLPLSKPALTTLAIFTFVGTWNDFLRPLIFLSSNDHQTLTLGIYTAQGLFSTNWPALMATVGLSLLPVVVMFLCLQDLFVKGVALTGLK
ncbi:ABC transporter permease subunit [Rhizobium lusitanum]|uniref:ABC transporter permease subunit n=2 Tax=Rhizobium lusitanum TaxID=293958 RepID=A0A6L9UG66_9HYPH|nr:ABC transporter permease subunit [Rhizobium lusitanum]